MSIAQVVLDFFEPFYALMRNNYLIDESELKINSSYQLIREANYSDKLIEF